jgi:hypothetical protein
MNTVAIGPQSSKYRHCQVLSPMREKKVKGSSNYWDYALTLSCGNSSALEQVLRPTTTLVSSKCNQNEVVCLPACRCHSRQLTLDPQFNVRSGHRVKFSYAKNKVSNKMSIIVKPQTWIQNSKSSSAMSIAQANFSR